MSNALRPHELQQIRPSCPSPTPGVYTNPCPLSQWCHPTILSSVIPFSFCPQSFPASGSFPMSQLFAWGGQSIGVSASASVLPMNTQDWFPLGCPRDSQESSPTPQFKSINSSALSFLYSPTLMSIKDRVESHLLLLLVSENHRTLKIKIQDGLKIESHLVCLYCSNKIWINKTHSLGSL